VAWREHDREVFIGGHVDKGNYADVALDGLNGPDEVHDGD